jgi:hypothetical protein
MNMPNQESIRRDREKDEHPDAKPYFQGRLTKAVLMSLPEGVILQSNVGHDPFTPVFEDVLGPMAKREEVWAKMRALKVAGRMFRAFTAKESYEHELRQRLNAINPPALIN